MGKEIKKCNGIGYFSLARGLGMITIVLGHSITPILSIEEKQELFSGAGSVWGAGIIAMFFMISGFGFYKRSFRKCIAIQSKLLLRPYICVAGCVLLSKIVLAFVKQRSFRKHGGELVLTYLFGLNGEGGGEILGIPIESVSIFWFVLALFGGWMIYNEIQRIPLKAVQWAVIMICVLTSYWLTMISKIWPFCLPMVLLATAYLAIGDIIRKQQLLEKRLPIWAWILIFVNIIVSMAYGQINIVACVWKMGILDVTGSFCMGFIFLRLYTKIMQDSFEGKCFELIEKIGFYSIWVVCLHAYEKIVFPWYRIYAIWPQTPWLAVVVCFMGRCIVMYVLYRMASFFIHIKKKRKKMVVLED